MNNTERNQENIFPITWARWDEAGGDYGDIIFYDVIFTEDFGPVKKDTHYDTVAIEYKKATVTCANIGKEEKGYSPCVDILEINFKMIAI